MFKFITILLIEILVGAEVDLFIPSFPELQKVFNITPFMVQLTLSVNFVAYCLSCLFAGTLGDRYNRRHVMLWSLFIFIVGSVLCVSAQYYIMLVLGRFLQGIGAAAPAVLSYVILADETPIEKQPALMGILNGIITLAMACAPVVGSFVNLYFNWRGNFYILLGLGVIGFVAGYFAIPSRRPDPSVSLSLMAYIPLLKSEKLRAYFYCVGFLCVSYWLFIGMAPIFYMEGMGVPLKEFGFYQGSLALAFSICSITSPIVLKTFGNEKCLQFGKWTSLIGVLVVLAFCILDVHDPMVITGGILILSVGAIFPVNILYPHALEIESDSKGRVAALMQALRLILTAFFIQLVSFYYDGRFLPIGLGMFFCTFLAIVLLQKMLQRKWILLAAPA
jgi:DHA1 family bicyclomycin/chloramphenicol resistance-like MFS transporter